MSDNWVVEIDDGDGDPDYYGSFATYEAANEWCADKGIEGAIMLLIESPEDYDPRRRALNH